MKQLSLVAMFKFVCTLLLLMEAMPICPAEKRGLSRIRYRFTSCNITGIDGPTFSQCSSYYKSIGSPIHSDGVLNDSPMQQGYPGGQGFVFPRTGWYNITVAGAAGGRGLCNPEKGKGVVTSGRLYVEKGVNDSVLVMVGQQGRGPCDVNSTHPLCLLDVSNTTSAAECYSKWVNQYPTDVRQYTGGGSGGGASMLWPPDSSGRYDTIKSFPYVVSGGGGGTSVELNYAAFVLPPNSTAEEYYMFVINGKYRFAGHTRLPFGSSGTRPIGAATPTAGAGGGYFHEIQGAPLPIDGKSISQPTLFADGGEDCALLYSRFYVPFKNVFGGFGGGGGGCNGGGGGGGYTGGSVLAATFDVPGEGGFTIRAFVVEDAMELPLNDGDGYVDIVPSDCGCVGECVLFENEDMFDCRCNTSSGQLAPDGFGCYTMTYLHTNTTPSVNASRSTDQHPHLLFSLLVPQVSFTIYSMNVAVNIQNTTDGDTCGILWLNRDNPVLATNRYPGILNSLSSITVHENLSVTMSEFTSFLNRGIAVTHGLLVSTVPCTIQDSLISANISTTGIEPSLPINISDVLRDLGVQIAALNVLGVQDSPGLPNPEPTNSGHPSPGLPLSLSPMEIFITIGVLGACVLLLSIIVFVICGVTLCFYRKRKRGKADFENSGGLTRPFILSKSSSKLSNTSNTEKRYSNTGKNSSLRPNLAYYETNIRRASLNATVEPYEEIILGDTMPMVNQSRVRNTIFTFRPRYGILPPDIDFTQYNATRSDDNWAYNRSNLVYMRDIGEGEFGKVLLMKAKNIAGYRGMLPVAVKTLSSTDEHDLHKFMEEIDLMKRFCHPNIVSLLGVNCHYSEGAPLMILEYMPYGDLRSFLQQHSPDRSSNRQTLISKQLQLNFAKDIAHALSFLECHKYVHRDVATRNCLINSSLIVKLADFGMARGVQEKDYYRIAGQAVLPVRWLAPESLVYGVFTSASDVWSYGVVLWEIAAFGQCPLVSMQADEIIKMAEKGCLVHKIPTECSNDLYTIITQCHNIKPEHRPTFSEILMLLPSQDNNIDQSLDMDIYESTDHM